MKEEKYVSYQYSKDEIRGNKISNYRENYSFEEILASMKCGDVFRVCDTFNLNKLAIKKIDDDNNNYKNHMLLVHMDVEHPEYDDETEILEIKDSLKEILKNRKIVNMFNNGEYERSYISDEKNFKNINIKMTENKKTKKNDGKLYALIINQNVADESDMFFIKILDSLKMEELIGSLARVGIGQTEDDDYFKITKDLFKEIDRKEVDVLRKFGLLNISTGYVSIYNNDDEYCFILD